MRRVKCCRFLLVRRRRCVAFFFHLCSTYGPDRILLQGSWLDVAAAINTLYYSGLWLLSVSRKRRARTTKTRNRKSQERRSFKIQGRRHMRTPSQHGSFAFSVDTDRQQADRLLCVRLQNLYHGTRLASPLQVHVQQYVLGGSARCAKKELSDS